MDAISFELIFGQGKAFGIIESNVRLIEKDIAHNKGISRIVKQTAEAQAMAARAHAGWHAANLRIRELELQLEAFNKGDE